MPADVWEQAAPLVARELSDEHRQILVEGSGIDPDIIEGRGYYSPTRDQITAFVEVGLTSPVLLKAESWLSIPMYRPDGEKHGELLRVFGLSLPNKYVWPTNSRNALLVHPEYLDKILDVDVPVIFAEGVKKGDALLSAARQEDLSCVVIAINGNYGWKARLDAGNTIACPDFLDFPIKGRYCYTTPDSDFRTNDMVRRGWSELATYLSSKSGHRHVYVAVVPPHGLEKQGADDYLVGGGTLRDLLGAATTPTFALVDAPTQEAPPLLVKTAAVLISEAVTDVPHLIHPMLPEESILVFAGHSGTYKTWHALTLALDGAFALAWIDHPEMTQPEPFSTLYVNKEMGSRMLGQRLRMIAHDERYARHADFERVIEDRIFFSDEAILDLAYDEQRDRLEAAILQLGVRFVILDSFSMCWSGDENSAAEVGRFYSQLRGITERTGVAWGLIHHLLKPAGISKKEPALFSVRGSGQIMQQADSALILATYEHERRTESTRELSIIHAKARTSLELPGFISTFDSHEGRYVSMRYSGKVSEAAGAALSATADPRKLGAWIMTELLESKALVPSGPGLRDKQLVGMLTNNWRGEGRAPSPAVLQSYLDGFIGSGDLEVTHEERGRGKLMKFLPGPNYDAQLTLSANRASALVGTPPTEPEEETEILSEELS